MNKKGDLSMGVIIGAAIALVVLVLLTVMVIRAGGGVMAGTSCDGIQDAFCDDKENSCSDNDGFGVKYTTDISKECPEDMKCCIPIKYG